MEEVTADRFPQTRHSVIAAVQGSDPGEKSRAIEAITAAYWKPIYKHLRLRWELDSPDAQDLTQEFFARLIEKDFLSSYDASKGRLRTFLRTCADRLLQKQTRDSQRVKRGGDNPHIELDFDTADRELGQTSVSSTDSIEQQFEREWLRSLFTLGLERLRRKYAVGKTVPLALFERYDLAEDEDRKPTYATLAQEFHVSGTVVTNYLAAARRDFRQCVLDQLRDMTASEEEFQAEARNLLGFTGEGRSQ
jgi:DNA-directed RNA polymerase specialized sigma24 family protein